MFKLENLLCNDFFPDELPPCYNTDSIRNKLNEPEIKKIYENNAVTITTPLFFSGYKSENSRRKFAIPNYVSYMQLAKVIVDNSEKLFSLFSQNTVSLTVPISKKPDTNESYSKKCKNYQESKFEIEKLYYCSHNELRLDISSFFDSIYTHTIAWAIETKQIAKKNHNNELLGNQLDELIRGMNNNQTNGILIGNALSRIISEIILCDVDKNIKKELKHVKYRRYVDDYFIFTENSYEIPRIIAVFRKHLNDYNLSLNENKIQINKSPFIYNKPWIESVRQYMHLEPIAFLDRLIVDFKKYADVSLLRYGLKIISLYDFPKNQWITFEPKIFNILMTAPSLADIITNILIINKKYINKIYFKRTIYSIIDKSIRLSYDQELIWMMWYVKLFEIEISIEKTMSVLNTDNILAQIILLDYLKISHKTKFNHNKIKKWRRDIAKKMKGVDENNRNVMESRYWLLAYEGTRNKWFNFGNSEFKQLNQSEEFVTLLKNGVAFYNNDYIYKSANIEYKPCYISRDEVIEKFKEIVKYINSLLKEGENVLNKEFIRTLDNFDKTILSSFY